VLFSPFTWLRVLLAAIFVAVLFAVIASAVFGEGAGEAVIGSWFFWALVAVIAVTVPTAKVIQAEERAGREADSQNLLRLAAGLGIAALVLYLGFGLSGAFSGEVSAQEVEAQAVEVSEERAARCGEGGEDSLGDHVWRCDMTLRGSPPYEDLEGKHLEQCFAFGGVDIESMNEVSCDRLEPENGGRPNTAPE